MFILHMTSFGQKNSSPRILKITIPEDLDYDGVFEPVFNTYTTSKKLARIRTTELGSLYELIYDISLKKNTNEKEFIDELRCRNGNLSIVLSLASDVPYGKF